MLGDHGNGPKGIMGKLKKVKDTVSQHLQENSVTLQQTRTVSPEPERYRLETSSTMPTPSVPLLARPEVAKLDEQVMPQSSIAIEPEIVTRPFVKVKVVTWNMAESLPTGDLTELLGHVPRPDAANNLPRSPLNPELPELTLNDGVLISRSIRDRLFRLTHLLVIQTTSTTSLWSALKSLPGFLPRSTTLERVVGGPAESTRHGRKF